MTPSKPDGSQPSPHGTFLALLQLLRLPNLFTAMADSAMGFLFVGGMSRPGEEHLLGMLMACSALFYAAGVVLNDVYDLPCDRQYRPERPIPAGRISVRAAMMLGWQLLIAALVLAAVIGLLTGTFRTAIVGLVLSGCVVLYNLWAKKTPLGPVVMGACRMSNVLLGMSLLQAADGGAGPWQAVHWVVVASIGVYIAGVTWFARTEARESNRVQLASAMVVIWAGMGLLASLPHWTDQGIGAQGVMLDRWYLMMVILAALIGWRCIRAIADPRPALVQMAVGHAILSVVVLDAVACYAMRGPFWAVVVLVLVLPAMAFGRWIRTT